MIHGVCKYVRWTDGEIIESVTNGVPKRVKGKVVEYGFMVDSPDKKTFVHEPKGTGTDFDRVCKEWLDGTRPAV